MALRLAKRHLTHNLEAHWLGPIRYQDEQTRLRRLLENGLHWPPQQKRRPNDLIIAAFGRPQQQ